MQLFGRQSGLPKYLSEVSKTIESLPVPEGQRWFWGGIIHFLPVAIGLAVLFICRASYYQYGLAEGAALLLAGTWGWIGPSLIWRYECRTLPTFLLKCERVVRSRPSFENVRGRVYSNVFGDRVCVVISAAWVILTVAGFLWVTPFVDGFGFLGRKDWLWLVMLVGVALYGYYSSIGFCFVYKTIVLTKMVVVDEIEADVYNDDGVFGFSFIGEFALESSLMFLSGLVFVPLLFMITQQVASNDYVVPVTLVGAYMAVVMVSFAYPICNVHTKIVREKRRVLNKYLSRASRLGLGLEENANQKAFNAWCYHREMAKDVRITSEWPLSIDTLGRFALSAMVAPILVTMLARLLAEG